MQYLIPALFLTAILTLLFRTPRRALSNRLSKDPSLLIAAALSLAVLFAGVLLYYHAFGWQLVGLILLYTLLPSSVILVQGRVSGATWVDLGVILFLWLPLEFGVGARFLARSAQGAVHTAAYGISILLALTLFLLFRDFKGMKYNLPRGPMDLLNPLIGYLLVGPILIILGLLLGFMRPFHAPPHLLAWSLVSRYLLILVATALPEEILFRALLQNWLTQRFGASNQTILVAAVIFGASHLNNGPGPLPNWRYALLAAIAGFAFGKVFARSSSVLSSAALHALVNTTKHVFF